MVWVVSLRHYFPCPFSYLPEGEPCGEQRLVDQDGLVFDRDIFIHLLHDDLTGREANSGGLHLSKGRHITGREKENITIQLHVLNKEQSYSNERLQHYCMEEEIIIILLLDKMQYLQQPIWWKVQEKSKKWLGKKT